MGAGANLYVAAGDAFAAIVHVLEATGRFKIVSRPTVFTSNNKKAIIASGQEGPGAGKHPFECRLKWHHQTTIQPPCNRASNTKRSCFSLRCVPLINSEKEVSLDILQKVDSLVPNGAETSVAIRSQQSTQSISVPTFLLGTDRPLSWAD